MTSESKYACPGDLVECSYGAALREARGELAHLRYTLVQREAEIARLRALLKASAEVASAVSVLDSIGLLR